MRGLADKLHGFSGADIPFPAHHRSPAETNHRVMHVDGFPLHEYEPKDIPAMQVMDGRYGMNAIGRKLRDVAVQSFNFAVSSTLLEAGSTMEPWTSRGKMVAGIRKFR